MYTKAQLSERFLRIYGRAQQELQKAWANRHEEIADWKRKTAQRSQRGRQRLTA